MSLLRRLHRWFGLALALPLVLQAVSGLVLTLDDPVTDWLAPSVAVFGFPQPAGAVLAAARAGAPAGLAPTGYQAPRSATTAAVVRFGVPGERGVAAEVTVDPYTLQVLGTVTLWPRLRTWLHALHGNLLLPGYGRAVVGWVGVGLVLLLLSGVPLWWPRPGRWRAALSVSRKARGVRLQRELHAVAGVWSVLLLLLMGATGVSLAFPEPIRAALGLPGRGGERGGERGAQTRERGPAPDIDAAIARAQAAVPDAPLLGVMLPQAGPATVLLDAGGTPLRVQVDGTGRVAPVQRPQAQPVAAQALALARRLHAGTAFGTAWRAMVALSGLVLLLLPVTGVAAWLLRRRIKSRSRRARLAPSPAANLGELS